MRKGLLITLIVSGGLVVTGGILFSVTASNGMLEPNAFTKEKVVEESFVNFDIDLSVSDVTFKKSTNDKCKIECVEKERLYYNIKVVNNTLTIKQIDKLKFYEKMFGYNSLKLTIYLPETNYNNFKIETSTGDINFENGFTFNDYNVRVSTGDVSIKNINVNGKVTAKSSTGNFAFKNVTCESAYVEASTGKIKFDNFISSGELNVKTSTGDVNFLNSDAKTLNIKTSTGDVRGNLLTDKTFLVKTSTGRKSYPNTTGPICEISTSTGDIVIEVKTAQ